MNTLHYLLKDFITQNSFNMNAGVIKSFNVNNTYDVDVDGLTYFEVENLSSQELLIGSIVLFADVNNTYYIIKEFNYETLNLIANTIIKKGKTEINNVEIVSNEINENYNLISKEENLINDKKDFIDNYLLQSNEININTNSLKQNNVELTSMFNDLSIMLNAVITALNVIAAGSATPIQSLLVNYDLKLNQMKTKITLPNNVEQTVNSIEDNFIQEQNNRKQ